MKNKPTRHKETNTFKFLPFSERISHLDVDVFHRIGHRNEEYNEEETFFHQTLQKWNVLNISESYEAFRNELPSVQTLPMLLNERDIVIDVILKHLAKRNPLSLQVILDLLAALMRDLRHEVYASYGIILRSLCNLLSTKDADELEWTFTCLAYMFKYLWRYIVKDVDTVFDSLVPLFSDSRPHYIRSFAAESFAYVVRKVKNKKEFVNLLLRTLENRKDGVEGCGCLMFEVLRGVRGRFHSFAKEFLPLVMEMLYDPSVNSLLLYELSKHMFSAMCSSIEPKYFSLVWNTAFEVIFSHQESKGTTESQCLVLKLINQIVNYKNCLLVIGPHIVSNVLKLLENVSEEKISVILSQTIGVVLLSPNVLLSQENAQQLTRKTLMLPYEQTVLDFICQILQYQGFETFVLPWVQNYVCNEIQKYLMLSSPTTLNKTVFNILPRMILQKAPPSIYGIHLESCRKYQLDLTMFSDHTISHQKVSVFETLFFQKNCDFSSFNDIDFEELISMLLVLPNVKIIQKEIVYDTLRNLMTKLTSELCSYNNIVKADDKLLHQKLFTFLILLGAQIHIMDFKDVEDVCSVNFMMDTILPLANRPFFISALSAVDLYITAMRIQKRDEQFRSYLLKEIHSSILENLSSPYHKIRLLTSHILSLFVMPDCENPLSSFKSCYEAESLSVTIQNFRDKISLLEKLSFDVVGRKGDFLDAPLKFLLGVLYENFQLLWEPVIHLIASYAQGMPLMSFWKIFEAQLKNAVQNVLDKEPFIINSCPFSNIAIAELYDNLYKFEDRPDFWNYRVLLWKSFAEFPELCSVKSRDVSPIFLNFLEAEYFKINSDDFQFCSVQRHQSLDCKINEFEPKEIHEVQRKKGDEKLKRLQLYQSLLAHMKVFAKLKSPKAIHKEPQLKNHYYNLLAHKNSSIQKMALDCLMTYKEKFLIPYSEHLYGLLNDKTFKSEITLFRIDKETTIVQEEHRADLIPVVIRILYGRMLTRTGRGSSGKGSADLRRSLVLRFLSGCHDNEMIMFLKLAFKVYLPYLCGNAESMVEEIIKKTDLNYVIALKCLRSSINMILVTMEKFGALMGNKVLLFVLHTLICIGTMISSILAHKTEILASYASGIRSLQSTSIVALAKFFSRFSDYPWTPQDLNAVFMIFVWPGLRKLSIEGIHSPTALLKLLFTWSRDPRYFYLLMKSKDEDNITPLEAIMKLLVVPKIHHSVTNSIMEIVEALLTTANYSEENLEETECKVVIHTLKVQVLNYGSKILLPHVPVIIQHLKQKLTVGKRRGLGSRDILILSRVCELEVDAETSESLLNLLFLAFLKKVDGPEQTTIHLVSTICSLLKNVSAPLQYLKCIAPLFGTVSSIGARKMLCIVLTDLVEKDNEIHKETLLQNIQLILDLNAWDKKWVEQPDFGRRLDGFKSVHRMIEKEKIMSNLGLIIVHNCFFILKHEKDLSLRDSAGYCLHKLSPFLCKQAMLTKSSHIPESILRLITGGIREKCNENLHDEAISLLGELVRECCETHPVFLDLKELVCKEDMEVDFFNNIIHLQSHRRARALMRFCSVAKQLVKPPRTQTMTQIILPLVSSFLCSEKYANRRNIVDAGVIAIGVVCKLLPWFHYETLLRFYLNKLHTVPAFQKQLVRVVISILDAFHFDVSLATDVCKSNYDKLNVDTKNSSEETIIQVNESETNDDHVVQEKLQEGETELSDEEKEESEEKNKGKLEEKPITEDAVIDENDVKLSFEEELESALDNISVEENDEMEVREILPLQIEDPFVFRLVKLSEAAATRVICSITRGLLPQLKRTISLVNKSDAHKVNRKKTAAEQEEEDTMCIPVALAIVKLLQQLPPQYLDQHLPGVFLNICTFLKSRLESVRRVAREMLKKIMASLGPSYLGVLLTEMIALLTKGFQIHVLIFTIHSVLSSMKPMFKPVDMDACLDQILEICKMDLFGKASEEKDVAQIAGKIIEARSHKSYDTLSIAAQYITEKCLVDLLLPLKDVLATTHSYSTLVRVSEGLRRIVIGLNDNTFVSIESLLMFIYGVVSGSIVAFKMNSSQAATKKEILQTVPERPDSFLLPQAPRTRYGAVTAKPNLSSDRNAHMLVEFGFHLLHILLKRGKASSPGFAVYIDPLVPILQNNINVQHVKLTTITLQCFVYVFKMDLPNLRRNIDTLTTSLFSLLHKYATTGLSQGEYMDMVIAAFKTVTILVRDVKYHVINDLQLKALLLYIEQGMHDFARQSTAFPLLKAILSRKLDVPEVSEVMTKVAQLSIVSEHDHVRAQARQVFYHFLMNYPLGHKVDVHINFYISQLTYELESGRLSALQIIHRMIATFPDDALSKYAGIFFVALGASLVNDERPNCKKMAAKCIKTLLTRDEADRDKLFNTTVLWMKDQKITHRRLGAQICGIFVEVEAGRFVRRLNDLLPVAQTQLTARINFLYAPGKSVKLACEANENETSRKRKLRLEDHCIFQVLRLIKKICILCPTFLTDDIWMQHVENIGDATQYLLGHPHEWIRLEASAVLGHIFASLDITSLVKAITSSSFIEGRYLFHSTGSKLKSLVLDFCDQLVPNSTGSQLTEQVTKNLAFLCRVVQALPEDAEQSAENGVNISLMWLIRKMRKIVNMEVVQTPHTFTMREAVFKWIGALVVDLKKDRLQSVVSQVLAPLAREMFHEEESQPDVLQLAKGVAKIIKKKLGVEEYTKQLSKLQVHLATKRAIRKRDRVQEVVLNPEMAAKRKIKKQQRKKVLKKRKMDEWKGRVAPKKKRKSNNFHDSENSVSRKKKWVITEVTTNVREN